MISALWTEVCLTFPALMALEAGYEVYVVTDTSGGTSVDAHERSIDRMVQAGAVPVTAAGAAGVPARLVAQSDLRCGNGPGCANTAAPTDGRGLRLYHGAWRAGA